MSTWYPNITFPFGTLICTKGISKTNSHSTASEDPDMANEYNSDDSYVPDVFKTTSQDQEILDNISLVLENSPVKFQVTKHVEELQPSILHYLRKKVNKIQKQFVNKLLEHVAPRQGNLLGNMLFSEKIQQFMFFQKLRNFMTHLFQAVVTTKNVPFYPLYQIHAIKQKS